MNRLEWRSDFAGVLLENVFIPDDKPDNGKLVYEGMVDQDIERGIFAVVDGIDNPFRDGSSVGYQYDGAEQNCG